MVISRQLIVFVVGACCLLSIEFGLLPLLDVKEESDAGQKTVTLSGADLQKIRLNLKEKIGAEPTPPQFDAAVIKAIDNEILINEALLMGIQHSDSVVRQRILKNMTFVSGGDEGGQSASVLLEKAEKLGMFQHDIVVRRRLIERMKKIITHQVNKEPNENQLKQFWEKKVAGSEKLEIADQKTRYQSSQAVRLAHGYFSISKYPPDDIELFYDRWVSGELKDDGMQQLSTRVLVSEKAYLSHAMTKQLLGEKIAGIIQDTLTASVALPIGVTLPMQKGIGGFHFIRIVDFREQRAMEYSEIKNQLKTDYIDDQRKQVLVATLEELRGEYSVDRP